MAKASAPVVPAEAAVPFAEFLESVPPGSVTPVSALGDTSWFNANKRSLISAPDIQLHCGNESCGGTRFFRLVGDRIAVSPAEWRFVYLKYVCSNCRQVEKVFSLALYWDQEPSEGKAFKFGELPNYGPPTPARLIKLIGPDREVFLKGRRCENLGLGIGAFVYYRRVVENQKNRILGEVIKVAQAVGASADSLSELQAAVEETQFSKALGSVKHSIPQSLLINGHNPLLLLHSALSEGLHNKTDSECLESAASVRIVLAELSERLAQALKDEAELNRALAHLAKRENT